MGLLTQVHRSSTAGYSEMARGTRSIHEPLRKSQETSTSDWDLAVEKQAIRTLADKPPLILVAVWNS